MARPELRGKIRIGHSDNTRWLERGAIIVLLSCALLSGCSRLRPKLGPQYVYCVAKQTFLRDRIAAVSNRTGTIDNGERLQVLERGRRFLRVRTDKGEQGWIDEKLVANQDIYDAFTTLAQEYAKAPTVASGITRDEVYMHVKPGRETDHLFRLGESDKLQLLRRAIVEKQQPATAVRALPRNAPPAVPGTGVRANITPLPTADQPAPTVYEDWWLARDSEGQVGWLLSRMVDVDAPDVLTRYAEGQRIVGAYVLTTIYDPDAYAPKEEAGSKKKKSGFAATPNDRANTGVGVTIAAAAQPVSDQIPVYVAVLSPYKSGLPYDFDQVRVFLWNAKKHRYETAFRERNVEGFLPVTIKTMMDPYARPGMPNPALPAFTYRILPAGAPPVVPDANGEVHPAHLIDKTMRLEGNIMRRMLPPGTVAIEEAHPDPEPSKQDKKASKHRR
jgi:hypothetical protein